MDKQELSPQAKILIGKYMTTWIATISSLLIIIFGGIGAILYNSIEKIGSSTAETAAKTAVTEKINELEKIIDQSKEKLDDLISSTQNYRIETTRSMEVALTQAEISKQRIEEFRDSVLESEHALKEARKLTKDISAISSSLSSNDTFLKQVTDKLSSVPSGAVVAFSSDKCPDGWKEYIPARGRVIVGEGRGEGLTPRKIEDQGGEENHLLTIEEMPKHSHKYGDWYYFDQAKPVKDFATKTGDDTGARAEKKRESSKVGGGIAHNNMPPFVVLRYCRKLE